MHACALRAACVRVGMSVSEIWGWVWVWVSMQAWVWVWVWVRAWG